jgi:hypothetical protein
VPRLRPRALVVTLVTTYALLAAPTWASAACGTSGYGYAGLGASRPAYGVATWLRTETAPEVLSGHVAGWVGVGGPGA